MWRLVVLYVEVFLNCCSETSFRVALIKKKIWKKKWVYTDVGSANQAELIVRNVWLLSGWLAVCLSGERDDSAGLRMVITPTSRTAGVETLECFQAGNVICATIWGESGSITFVKPHPQVLTSVMCENVSLYWNSFIWYSYVLLFLSLSLALRSISQWPLTSLRPMVRIIFFQCWLDWLVDWLDRIRFCLNLWFVSLFKL